jgi:hypothetical protein
LLSLDFGFFKKITSFEGSIVRMISIYSSSIGRNEQIRSSVDLYNKMGSTDCDFRYLCRSCIMFYVRTWRQRHPPWPPSKYRFFAKPYGFVIRIWTKSLHFNGVKGVSPLAGVWGRRPQGLNWMTPMLSRFFSGCPLRRWSCESHTCGWW